MAKARPAKISWRSDVKSHDYPAAESYLSLLYGEDQVRGMVKRLKNVPVVEFKAKDIFRAARLALLGADNSHVKADLERMKEGQKLSPLLLVRNEEIGQVVIADGYHRLCAVYSVDEDATIPCKII
jgi:disulfide oxidoreductase YuzD